jgi:hypothetical protein
MSVLRYFSIPRAVRDFRRLMASRRNPYEIWFMLAAMAVTMLIILAFAHDSNFKKAYHENLIYVQSWRADRSEAEILAQQKLDAAEKAKQEAEIEKAEKERQAQFQKLQNVTAPWL